jgi:hypothetical protein
MLHSNKDELLLVLDRPDIPLNTNDSENDIRAFVTKRKISGGTVSDNGREARDVMLGLSKTCRKLKVSFYDFLGDRLGHGFDVAVGRMVENENSGHRSTPAGSGKGEAA